jgi:hypothetical protein
MRGAISEILIQTNSISYLVKHPWLLKNLNAQKFNIQIRPYSKTIQKPFWPKLPSISISFVNDIVMTTFFVLLMSWNLSGRLNFKVEQRSGKPYI